jgi:hypothetical protein
MKVKPIADVMRAGGAMIGKAREAVSKTLNRVQSGLEGRLSRAQQTLTRDQARLETWKELEQNFEKLATLDEAYRNAESWHAEALEYYDENPGDPYAGVGLFLAREEHERLKAEREAERAPRGEGEAPQGTQRDIGRRLPGSHDGSAGGGGRAGNSARVREEEGERLRRADRCRQGGSPKRRGRGQTVNRGSEGGEGGASEGMAGAQTQDLRVVQAKRAGKRTRRGVTS